MVDVSQAAGSWTKWMSTFRQSLEEEREREQRWCVLLQMVSEVQELEISDQVLKQVQVKEKVQSKRLRSINMSTTSKIKIYESREQSATHSFSSKRQFGLRLPSTS